MKDFLFFNMLLSPENNWHFMYCAAEIYYKKNQNGTFHLFKLSKQKGVNKDKTGHMVPPGGQGNWDHHIGYTLRKSPLPPREVTSCKIPHLGSWHNVTSILLCSKSLMVDRLYVYHSDSFWVFLPIITELQGPDSS